MYSENMTIAIFDDLARLKQKKKILEEKVLSHHGNIFSLLTIVNTHFYHKHFLFQKI